MIERRWALCSDFGEVIYAIPRLGHIAAHGGTARHIVSSKVVGGTFGSKDLELP